MAILYTECPDNAIDIVDDRYFFVCSIGKQGGLLYYDKVNDNIVHLTVDYNFVTRSEFPTQLSISATKLKIKQITLTKSPIYMNGFRADFGRYIFGRYIEDSKRLEICSLAILKKAKVKYNIVGKMDEHLMTNDFILLSDVDYAMFRFYFSEHFR